MGEPVGLGSRTLDGFLAVAIICLLGEWPTTNLIQRGHFYSAQKGTF